MRPSDPLAAGVCEAFEAVSRGDFVRGLLWRGAGPSPRALVVVTPALGSGKHAPEITALCRALSGQGLLAAAIDLPLQGERASSKLSDRLVHCATRGGLREADRLLWSEFLKQSALDLEASTAQLAGREGLSPLRLGCAAFEPGAEAAAGWAAREPRVRVCLRLPPGSDPDGIAARLREQLA